MLNILLGLLGLSIVIIVHELGHFFAAKANGVEVEAFSIGWGPRLFSFRRKGTEWKISALPIGGYCKMKGEESFKQAIEQDLSTLPREKGSFYAASPWRRISILLAGPFMNFVLAILFSTIVSWAGTSVQTIPNKIILASEYSAGISGSVQNPADLAGLKTGDLITSIDGKAVQDYSDLQQMIGINGGKTLHMTILRDGARQDITITPRLDKNSGQGLIGIYGWVEPVIGSIEKGSAAAIAGLVVGDRILSIDGTPVNNSLDIVKHLDSMPERIVIKAQRAGSIVDATLVLSYSGTDAQSAQSNIGIGFQTITRTTKASSLGEAVVMGFNETISTFVLSIKSFGLLFRGINIFNAISGPGRITYMVGSSATASFKQSGFAGILQVLSFLALISVSLGFMNLMPIPALDGGQVLLCVIELFRRKPLKVKTLYRYQSMGSVLVVALMLVAMVSDVMYFVKK
ncbi:MAG: RIP metalloprotease RseP [Spirochaetaceae bacterium]|nr:RIP metalloprotease RseP [Spirochaetaceae bacterium]